MSEAMPEQGETWGRISPLSSTGRNTGVMNPGIWSVDEMNVRVGEIRIV